jgi:tetratricopeptide (TPR) repeat protein
MWRIRKRPIAVLCVLLALTLWGIVLTRQVLAGRAQRHIDAGIEFVRSGRPREAEREWREAARLAPNNAIVWDLLSELYIDTQQWSKGTEALQNLRRVAPGRPYLYSKMAACALRTGNELEAQRLAQEELKRNPTDPASLTILAFLAEMQQDTERQIGYLQHLVAHSPNDVDALHDLIQAYAVAGKYPEALPIAEHLLAVRPQDSYAFALRGAARFETDASPAASAQAEADLLKALQGDPLSAFARYTLGRLYMREGRFDKAVFQLELAQKLTPLKMDVPFELATAYARMNQPAKAAAARQRFETLRQAANRVNELQKRCALDKNNFYAHLQLGQLLLQNADYRQALYYLQRALVLNPRSGAARDAYQKLAAQINSQMPSLPR